MSGIAGVFERGKRSTDRDTLRVSADRMADALEHRGPDGVGVVTDGPVAFVHRMLRVTPESLFETFPRQDGPLLLTADVRLDNRNEILAELDLRSTGEEPVTDGEILLAAYRKWGEGCPEHLDGDFAFAIWDGARERLLCVRDRFGVRPFYYHHSDEQFVFGTEIKALLQVRGVPRRLNEVRVADFLTTFSEDPAITFYEGIWRLPPARRLMVDRERMSIEEYWSLDPSRELRLSSDEEYAEGFRERFEDAVRHRLRSAYPVGAQLSGGLDSSSVACMARDLLAREGKTPLPTFSAIFEHVKKSDERFYINAAVAQGGIDPFFMTADEMSPLGILDDVHRHNDEALNAYNLYINWGLLGAARDRSVRVMLDGFDGDTTVSHGVGHLHHLARHHRWLDLIRWTVSYTRRVGQPTLPWIWSYVRHYGLEPLEPPVARRIRHGVARRLRRGKRAPWFAPMRADFFKRIDWVERRRALREGRRGTPETEREDHYRTLTSVVMPDILELLDHTAAAFGIEPRYPFWDRRLVEYCLSLPPEQKLRQGWTRYVLRRAMQGILPPEIQWRGDKSNLGPGLEHGLYTYDRSLLSGILDRDLPAISDYIDVNLVRGAFDRFSSHRGDSDDVSTVCSAVSLASWFKGAGVRP